MQRDGSQARLVLRQRGSQRLLLNANLYPKMATTKMVGGKGVTFAAVNAAPALQGADGGDAAQQQQAAEGAAADQQEAHAVMRTYAFKVKSPERIDAFVACVEAHKAPKGAAGAGEQQQQQRPPTGEAAV